MFKRVLRLGLREFMNDLSSFGTHSFLYTTHELFTQSKNRRKTRLKESTRVNSQVCKKAYLDPPKLLFGYFELFA